MDRVAHLRPKERQDLFRESAAQRGISPAIIEKDFWVCWVLKKLFTDEFFKEHLVFKGGTSLLKVFGTIDRFSEDIDLVLDWRLLGFGTEAQNSIPTFASNTQRDHFNKEINLKAAEYISGDFVQRLNTVFATVPENKASPNETDRNTLDVIYPASFSETYLRPAVQLEIGPLASWVPSSAYTIKPYAAEEFPNVFDDPVCPVIAIVAERTFWEKATILHQQAHRTGSMPPRYSRHYYDLHKLAESHVTERALADMKLLEDVVAFKQQFYPSPWARYDLAVPGTLRLLPKKAHIAELNKDYAQMDVMIFGEIPTFDKIMKTLERLERTVNRKPEPKD